ncbi:MAG: GspD family T2SS secretin variant LspD [Gammaproteobacteria bacterium]|nr:GspD family T2SS secretin variant LspD [Gammaproteobacteria bacterium]
MRLFAFLLLLCFSLGYADEAKIRTIILENKPAYLINVGDFATEADALEKIKQLKDQLPNTPMVPTQQTDTHRFSIKIGPIQQYAQAKLWQQQLSQSAPQLSPPTATLQEPIQRTSPPDSPPVSPPISSNKKLWNLSNADIRAVIAEVSRVTGKNFIIDPRVQGKISIISHTPLSNEALYQVFLSMLQISGYAAIPSGQAIKVMPNMDAKAFAPNAPKHSPLKGDEIMISVVPVHYVPAEQLVPTLRPLMPQWSYISAYVPANVLILSGRADNIRQLTQIIKQVDTSTSNGIDVVQLEHAMAMDIANTLKDLVKTTAGAGQTPTSLAVDDRNNSILLSGNKTDRIRLRVIIAKLDHQSINTASNNTQVVYLNYLRAEDLVPILAGVAQANFSGAVGVTIGTVTRPPLDSTNPNSNISTDPGNPYSQPSAPPPPPAAAATPNTSTSSSQSDGSTKPSVQLIAEPNTNSVIINAPASVIRILKTVISQLDIRPAQLLIEAMVAEINESDVNNLGVEWGSLGQGKNPSSFRPGFAIINSKTSVNDFQAQIYALQREHKANVLSTPSVVVLDNRQAKILVGQQVSVASTNYPNNAAGSTTASPYTTFNRVNVALHLYVRPQITRAGGIQLQIDEGNDTVDPSTINNSDNPVFKISSIVTSIHIQSGDVVVLGGLTQDSLANDNTNIPILKDIPGLGRLFQRNLRNREKRVLMVFIRPLIMRNAQDAVQITGSKYYNPIRSEELGFVREQEAFIQTDQQTVLPPLTQAKLPIPFTQPPPMTK